jgi:DNA replication protein DnaC
VPLTVAQLDTALAQAEREGLSHQQFLHRLISEQAERRRERSIAHRLREARLRERQPLCVFDWEFNRAAIDRVQIEELASGAFIARRDNLVFVGQSGVGKSFLIQAIAEAACVRGYSVRYTTSAALLNHLTASLADQTLPQRVRYYGRFDLLVIDEFGFEKIERSTSPQAANLLYKIIDARSRRRSTALVTNIDFPAWGDYLGDPPLAMAFLDRIVDGAIIVKINGKSYRAHRASTAKPASPAKP